MSAAGQRLLANVTTTELGAPITVILNWTAYDKDTAMKRTPAERRALKAAIEQETRAHAAAA